MTRQVDEAHVIARRHRGLPCRRGRPGARRPVPPPGPVGGQRPVRPAPPVRSTGADPRPDDGRRHHVRRLAGRVAVLLDLADGGQGQGPALPAVDHGALRRGRPGARSAHRPQPRGPAGDGGDLGPGSGGVLPVRGPGHPLAAALSRGLRHAGAVQGLPGHQGSPGARDGGARMLDGDGDGRPAAARPEPRRRPIRHRPRPFGGRTRTPPYGTPVVHVDDPGDRVPTDRAGPGHPQRPSRPAGLLSGFAFALPAVAILKLGGAAGPRCASVLVAVFAAAAARRCAAAGADRADPGTRAGLRGALGPGRGSWRRPRPWSSLPTSTTGPRTRRTWPPSGPSPTPR